ncbi:MAG: hypothetical protein AB1540_14640 [Bdellovibrionota bacterium]
MSALKISDRNLRFFSRKKTFAIFPLVFFAALLISRVHLPENLVFDEIHYVPAAKSLILFQDNLNWVHPPLGKLILGAGWWVFTKSLHLLSEPTVFRWMTLVFGLWVLWAVRGLLLALGYSQTATAAAVWLTGFNGLWFVQSKIAMLDIFYVAFGIWGLLEIHRQRLRGWLHLGLALACKWAALPFFAIGLFMGFNKRPGRLFLGLGLAFAAYFVCFIPLVFLEKNAVPLGSFFSYHTQMLEGFSHLIENTHPYASSWWQWPTLLRPLWYAFDDQSTAEHAVWAGGNPLLYWPALPLLVCVLYFGLFKKDQQARLLSLLYWVPLLFWAFSSRKLQLYYYYLPSSIWVGAVFVWAHEKAWGQYSALRRSRGWTLAGYVLLCGATFLYFLPVMDGRALLPGRHLLYMWLQSWI